MFGRRFYRVSYCGRRIAAVRPSGPESDVDLGLGWRREREKKMKRERERERERERRKPSGVSSLFFLSIVSAIDSTFVVRPSVRWNFCCSRTLFSIGSWTFLVFVGLGMRSAGRRNTKSKSTKKKTSKEKGKPNALALVIENGARPAKKKQSAIFRSNGDNFEAHRRAPHVVRRRRGKT